MIYYEHLSVIVYSALILGVFSLVGYSILSILKPSNSFVKDNSLIILPLLGGSFIMAVLPTLSYLGIKASISLSAVILLSIVVAAFCRPGSKRSDLSLSVGDIKILAFSTIIPSSVMTIRFVKYNVISPILTDVVDLGWYLALSKYLISGTLKELTTGIYGGGVVYEWAYRRVTTFGGYPTASHHVTAAFSELFGLQFYESYMILQPVCVSLGALGLILFVRYFKFDKEVEWLTLTLFLISFFSYSAAWGNHIPLAIAVGPGLTAILFGLIVAKDKFDFKICILLSIFLAGTCSAYSFYFLFMLLPAVVTFIYHNRFTDVISKFSVTILTLGLLVPFNFTNAFELVIIYFRLWVSSPIQYILVERGVLSGVNPHTMQEGMRLIENPWGVGYTLNIHTLFGIPFRQTERFAAYFSTGSTPLFSSDYYTFTGISIGVILVVFIILGIIKSRERYTMLSVPGIFFLIWLYLQVLGRTYYSFRFAVLFGPFVILFFSIGFLSVYHHVNDSDSSHKIFTKIILGCFLSAILIACLVGLHSGIVLSGVNGITEDGIKLGNAVENYVGPGEKILLLKDSREFRCEMTIVGLQIDHKSLGVLGEQFISVPGEFEMLPVWHNNSSFRDFHPKNLYDTSMFTTDVSYIIAPYLYEASELFSNYELVWNNSKYSLFRRSNNTTTVNFISKNSTTVNFKLMDSQRSGEVMINGNPYDLQFSPKTLAIFYEWYFIKDVVISTTYINGSRIEEEFNLYYPHILIIPIDGVEEISFHNIGSSVSKLGFSAEKLPTEVIKTILPREVLTEIYFEYDEDELSLKCTLNAYSDLSVNLVIINQSSRVILSKTPLNVSYPTSEYIEVDDIYKNDIILWIGNESDRTKAIFPVFTNDSNNTYHFRERMKLDHNSHILFP